MIPFQHLFPITSKALLLQSLILFFYKLPFSDRKIIFNESIRMELVEVNNKIETYLLNTSLPGHKIIQFQLTTCFQVVLN